MKKFIKIFRTNRGQAAVETALIIPFLLLILLIIIEFGRIFNAYLIVSNASREGARYAAVGYSYNKIENIIDNTTITIDNVVVTFNPSNQNDRVPGESVEVKVSGDLQLITPIIGSMISESNSYSIESSTIMRVE